jgi:hypothetical protein
LRCAENELATLPYLYGIRGALIAAESTRSYQQIFVKIEAAVLDRIV